MERKSEERSWQVVEIRGAVIKLLSNYKQSVADIRRAITITRNQLPSTLNYTYFISVLWSITKLICLAVNPIIMI